MSKHAVIYTRTALDQPGAARSTAQQEQVTAQLDALNAYCERVRRNLDTFGFEEKRLAIEALGVRVIASGRDWQLTGEIPMDVPDTGILSLTSR